MRSYVIKTDTQRLKAMIYANGLTIGEFSAIIGKTPETIERRLNNPFYSRWETKEIDLLENTLKRIDPTFKHADIEAVFYANEAPQRFAKPYFKAIAELGLGITEREAADKAGITIEELRTLYNACDTQAKLDKAARVWKATGQTGHWFGFFLSFLNYPETMAA